MDQKMYYQSKNENKSNVAGHSIECNRCHGNGHIPKFNHVEAGICFKCRGKGTVQSKN